ncbi:hypothetical protein [Alcaligenes faecalis]|uniref:hypothetical protein n=1 Tax=Alcaligenes faecalis TaxID=511 RepID=UPI001FF70227|nr:hypothetical protein [Alcaligenes faecalis]
MQASKRIAIEPVYYCAGNLDDNGTQKPYNLAKLMTFILDHVKAKKRLVFLQDINNTKENFESNDSSSYGEKIEDLLKDSWLQNIGDFLADTVKTATGVIKNVITSPAITEALTNLVLQFLKRKQYGLPRRQRPSIPSRRKGKRSSMISSIY